MAKAKELTVEDKLKALYNYQKLHSKLDEIHILQGELPMEVSDLEDELEGLETRMRKLNNDIETLETNIADQRNAIKDAEALIAKYDQQLNNVKNNREFDALNKEIELQKLEIQLAEKRIGEAGEEIEKKKAYLEESKEAAANKKENLELKKKELEKIIKENEKEEKKIEKEIEKQSKDIEERLLKAFHKIRKTYINRLAVVKIERDSCGGCFATIPPQRQVEIRQHKKIIVCEHCGRILVDPAIDFEEVE